MADDARRTPNEALLETSFLYGANAVFVEEMHARYLDNPNSVDSTWRAFFEQLNERPEDVRRSRTKNPEEARERRPW
jgi:2-oxoglutarate dehydrogenase E1 component